MSIGEDIPILIPISIILVVFLIFLISLLAGLSDQSEMLKMSQTSINVGRYVVNEKFSNSLGTIIPPPSDHFGCHDISELNISSNYKLKINITNLETGRYWCWGDISGSRNLVTNSFPVIIINNTWRNSAKVIVSVGK